MLGLSSYLSPDSSIRLASVFVACLFVAHPLQTQAVTYIVQRMTSLATLFYLLAVCLFIVARVTDKSPVRWGAWSGVALSTVLALGSKQSAVTLPITLLIYEWFFFRYMKPAISVK